MNACFQTPSGRKGMSWVGAEPHGYSLARADSRRALSEVLVRPAVAYLDMAVWPHEFRAYDQASGILNDFRP